MTGALLLSGTDLASVAIIEDLTEFWSGADVRGDLPVYAGRSGATAMRRPVAAKIRSGQVRIVGSSLGATEDQVATVKALLKIGQPQTATRRKVTSSGTLDTTQTVIVHPPAERWISPVACTLILSVETLDGPWYGSSESIAAAGTVTIKGDSPTRRITATLAAGAANPVVTNTTNGYTFRYVGTVPTGGVTVDLAARKATKVSDSSDVSSSLKWSKDDPFQLDPGANSITVSSGTLGLTYSPAYQ